MSDSLARFDANDLLYAIGSSRDYDPSDKLGEIIAPVMWVNSADDFINPPELGIMDRTIKRVKNGRYVLLPLVGRGHSSGYDPSLWKKYLEELLQQPEVEQKCSPTMECAWRDGVRGRDFTGTRV